MDKITIDRKSLFALASETRIKILKKIDSRRMTLTELSKELNLSKVTVKEHLDKLVEAGLVRKVDEGRKWVYYELTKKGKSILHPESRVKIIFLLSLALACIVGGLFELYRFISLSKKQPQPTLTPIPAPTPAPTPTTLITQEIHLLAGIVLIIVSVITLLACYYRKFRSL